MLCKVVILYYIYFVLLFCYYSFSMSPLLFPFIPGIKMFCIYLAIANKVLGKKYFLSMQMGGENGSQSESPFSLHLVLRAERGKVELRQGEC